MAEPGTIARRRRVVLALLLAGLGALKLGFDPGIGRHSTDGNYYFHIARQVAEGEGLTTRVSLYHQGLQHFPHPINQSPAWVLLLGLAGRVLGMERAAHWLPEWLYALDLLLAWVVLRRLFGPAGALRRVPWLDAAHAGVLLFGLNSIFFRFTSMPYTEGLGFAFLLSALLAVDRAARAERQGEGVVWAAAAGLAAAGAFLTRAQMVGLLAIVPLVLGVAASGGAARRVPRMAAACAGALLPLVPWWLYLAGWVRPFDWKVALGLAGLRETPELDVHERYAPLESPTRWLAVRLRGLAVAFHPWHRNGYAWLHGPAAWALPLLAAVAALRARGRVRAAARRISRPEAALPLAMAAAAVAMLGPLHVYHTTVFRPWLFSWRHGLPFLLVIALTGWAVALLGGRRLRALALVAVVASIVFQAYGLSRVLRRPFHEGPVGSEAALIAWLDARTPPPTVVSTRAQHLGAWSHANFHWASCGQDPAQTLALLEYAGADYLALYDGEQRCRAFRGLDHELAPVVRFQRGAPAITLLALRREQRGARPSRPADALR